MRRAIVKSMTASALVPQFTIESDARLDVLEARRDELERGGVGLSYSDVFVAACARTLRTHLNVNVSFDEDAIVEHPEINVGLAIALPDGLVAPAIRAADTLSFAGLAAERERLTVAARAGTLAPEEIFSTTFTISNLGPFGVRRFRALVVPPQAAILALGALTPEKTMSLSLSCDHRVLDGAPAAAFLRDLAVTLEQPGWMDDLLPGKQA
jgi:pyruvate dehydrogenase E2 component (dihydrolipoamide acetyltransferase)